MRRLYCLFTFFILCNFIIFAQDKLSGTYCSESGIILKLENNRFRLIIPNPAQNGWSSDIMAEGIIKKISPSFIELNSDKNTLVRMVQNIVVEQKIDSTVTDSIKIHFLIPFDRSKLQVSVLTDKFKKFYLNYSRNDQELNIPNDTKSFSFYIIPDHIGEQTFEGLFYGLVSFDSKGEYQIKDKINYIEIKIPDLDNTFFQKYYILGDYARVINNSIIWKGIVYKKTKDKI